jgi:hypothetical protein
LGPTIAVPGCFEVIYNLEMEDLFKKEINFFYNIKKKIQKNLVIIDDQPFPN